MTRLARNAILLTVIVIDAALIGASVALLATYPWSGSQPAEAEVGEVGSIQDAWNHVDGTFAPTQSWLGIRWRVAGAQYATLLIQAIAFVAWLCVVGWWRAFGRFPAPEIVPYALAVGLLPLDLVRTLLPPLVAGGTSLVATAVIARLSLFGYFATAFLSLAGALTARQGPRNRSVESLGVAVVVALALAYTVPIDTLTVRANLLPELGHRSLVQVVLFGVGLLAVAAAALSKTGNPDRSALSEALFVAILFLVRESLTSTPPPAFGAIVVLFFVGGAVYFGVSRRRRLLRL